MSPAFKSPVNSVWVFGVAMCFAVHLASVPTKASGQGTPLPNFSPGQIVPQQIPPGQNFQGQSFPGQSFPGQRFPGQNFPANPPAVETIVQPRFTERSVRSNPLSSSPSQNRVQVRSPKGNTWVEPPNALQDLVQRGGVPQSLEVLRLLQRQQQLVSARAADCTVSIQIGPAQGCGVIITPSGYVLTAAHVAMRPRKPAVLTLADGRTVTATTRGMNRHVDAGLMKIDPGQNGGKPWPCATLGSSANLKTGMWCIATGHPGGYDRDRGMVTRVGRILDVRKGSLVTDCALIGGDSGGPLFDISGRLIAVHSRIGNDVADNLHVPIDHYDDSWRRMDNYDSWGYLPGFKPSLGVSGNGNNEARIKTIRSGSPADEAGFKAEDVVERFGGIQITGFESLKNAVSDTMPGERVKVWVRRDGNLVPVVVEIGRANDL